MRSIWASVLVSTNRELYFYIQTSLHPESYDCTVIYDYKTWFIFFGDSLAKTGKSDETADLVPVRVPHLTPEEVWGGATATLVGYKGVKHEYSEYCVLLEEASNPLQTIFIYYIFGILLLILTVSTLIVGKAEVLQHAESLTETNGQKHI